MYVLYKGKTKEVHRNKSISELWVWAYNNGLVHFGVVAALLVKGYSIKYESPNKDNQAPQDSRP